MMVAFHVSDSGGSAVCCRAGTPASDFRTGAAGFGAPTLHRPLLLAAENALFANAASPGSMRTVVVLLIVRPSNLSTHQRERLTYVRRQAT